jgi:hypothetical protein
VIIKAGVKMTAAAGIVLNTATWIDPEAREALAWWESVTVSQPSH